MLHAPKITQWLNLQLPTLDDPQVVKSAIDFLRIHSGACCVPKDHRFVAVYQAMEKESLVTITQGCSTTSATAHLLTVRAYSFKTKTVPSEPAEKI